VTAWPVSELQDDGALVSSAREGDRAAFGRLYDRYARMVHGILLSRVPPREVDDLVQEVFLAAPLSTLGKTLWLRKNCSLGFTLARLPPNPRATPMPWPGSMLAIWRRLTNSGSARIG
jgi:hypothetical protein